MFVFRNDRFRRFALGLCFGTLLTAQNLEFAEPRIRILTTGGGLPAELDSLIWLIVLLALILFVLSCTVCAGVLWMRASAESALVARLRFGSSLLYTIGFFAGMAGGIVLCLYVFPSLFRRLFEALMPSIAAIILVIDIVRRHNEEAAKTPPPLPPTPHAAT
ncbi:hypothetical protein DB346_13395 [Verrucomicrobia bacterium LW23]|nr:hypothetical protein DB346_13395 [Verrucomicrobia bacterium LW23]